MEQATQQNPSLSDDEITALLDDPAKIETHEIALDVLAVLDAEIAAIQIQVDAATIEANIRPLTAERQAWLRRASYAGAMRRQGRHKVYQRDKELRGMKGRAFTEPKHTKEEKALKQQRLLTEAEDRRLKRTLAIEAQKTRQMEIAQQRRNNIVRAEINRGSKMNEWQPIETAPKGDEYILIWDGVGVSVACRGRSGSWHGTIGGKLVAEDDGYLTYLTPTHWMPLPPQPKT